MSDLLANLKKRRADWNDRLNKNRKAMADAMQAVLVDEAHLQELDFAIEALSIVPAPAPAAPPQKPQEKAPLAQCIEAIRLWHLESYEGSDRNVADMLKAKGHKFRLPTVRNALAEIGTPSRAAARPAETDAETDRSSQRTLETATPTNDGAGAESVDAVEAERPKFLTRAKAAAE